LEDSEETIIPPETHVETGMKTISMLRFFLINIDKLGVLQNLLVAFIN